MSYEGLCFKEYSIRIIISRRTYGLVVLAVAEDDVVVSEVFEAEDMESSDAVWSSSGCRDIREAFVMSSLIFRFGRRDGINA